MANSFNLTPTRKSEEDLFGDVLRHMQTGFDETDKRAIGTGRVGNITFNEVDELFRSWINENDWPYDALLFDPRVFTFITEKTSRLIATKPRGHLSPREGGDVLGAKINNAILDYQWDQATNGGPMISKWSMMDMNARKYGASFALCKWRYETNKKGECLFNGPDLKVLNNRDCAHALDATSIENCNWFQVREYVTLQELERVNDASQGKPIYKNLDKLREAINSVAGSGNGMGGGDTRSTNWMSRNRQISRLEVDPVGKDNVFKTVEIITEYRKDRWITFAPKHGVILRDIENPYKNNELPIIMLRYYAIDDDLYGLSEVEPVKSLQKAINALLCQYVDEINQNLYSPIAIGPGVKQHTLEWGKGARWIMNNPMTDFRIVEGKSNAAAYFNNTYSVLVSAMMNALGESSLGVSNMQPFQNDKTATEVKALTLQRNARDNNNQLFLSEAIKRQLMLWHSMNQILLFTDPKKQSYIIRIAGKDAVKFFEDRGLSETQLNGTTGDLADQLAQNKITPEQAQVPKYPVKIGTGKEEKTVPKLVIEQGGASARLAVEPEDLKGNFDFVVDVKSMAANAEDEKRQAQQMAVQLLTSNPNVGQMLAQEGIKPKFKDLFVDLLEELGFIDADKFFESLPESPQGAQPSGGGQGGPSGMPPMPTPPSSGGMPGLPPEGSEQTPPRGPNPEMLQQLMSAGGMNAR